MRSFAHFSGRSAKCQFVREHNHFLPALITPGRTHSHATDDFGCILNSLANVANAQFIQNTEAEHEGADIAKTKRKWRAISIIRQSETPQDSSFGFGSKEEDRDTCSKDPARGARQLGDLRPDPHISGHSLAGSGIPQLKIIGSLNPRDLEARNVTGKSNYSLITVFIISSQCTTPN